MTGLEDGDRRADPVPEAAGAGDERPEPSARVDGPSGDAAPEIVEPDPGAIRRAVVLLSVATIVGGLLIVLAQGWMESLEGWIEGDPDPPARLRLAFYGLLASMVVPILGGMVYLWHVGSRIARSGRFPPPGMKVLKPTPVLTGRAAWRRVMLFRGLAFGLGFTLLAFWWVIDRIVGLLQR